MKIALVSLNQIWEDKKSNLKECENYIKQASINDVELIIFPEMTLTAFSTNTKLISEDENNSFTINGFKTLSIIYNIAIVFGVVINEENKSSNRLYFINNLGNILNFYKKIHPFSFANEDKYYIGGDEIKTVEFKGIKFGLTICYDLRFSNLYHAISKQNTDCIINIASWPSKRIDHWNTLLKARAIESQQFIIGVNRIGSDDNNLNYIESSKVFNANGEKVETIKSIENMKIINLYKEHTSNFKSIFNTVQDYKKGFINENTKIKNILFRADSSSTIGTGHIMRDLVLASQYKDANITFAVQDLKGNINHKIIEAGYKLEILKSNSLEELDSLIKKLDIEMIIIDHYGIDYKFEKQLKIKNSSLKILSFDDTYEKHHCDILLNHNIYADETKYKKLVLQNCELRCGSKFTLLREEFVEAKKKNDIVKEDIFIGMGGADSANLSQKILQVLISLTNQKINVITTSANPNIDTLKAFVSQYSNIELHINSNQVAYLMKKSSLAIVSPSVILNELFYLDIPFIAIQTADNQKYMVKFLKKIDIRCWKNLIKIAL